MQYLRCSSSKWGSCSKGDLASCSPCTTIWVNFIQFSIEESLGARNPVHINHINRLENHKLDNSVVLLNPKTISAYTSSAGSHHCKLAANVDHLLEQSRALFHHKPLVYDRTTNEQQLTRMLLHATGSRPFSDKCPVTTLFWTIVHQNWREPHEWGGLGVVLCMEWAINRPGW